MQYRSKWLSRQYNIAISICLLFRKSCQHQRRSQRPEHATSHAKLQFREYQQERSESRKAAAAYRDSFWTGVRSPIPRWPRSHFQRLATYFTSRCCCCCCCCGLAPRWATHPTPCCCCCYPVTPVTRFPRPRPSQS